MKIKELPKNDMPYEKLEKFGERSLTESELLAIIIRNGNKNNNSIQIAQKILGEEHLKFRDIFYKSVEELISYPGIGKVKAIQIKAIGEIIRRVEIPLKSKREKISSTKDVGEKYMPKLRYLKIEEMYVIFLDAKNNVLKDKKIGNSSISSVDIDIEEIVRTAIITYCARMVVVHNHPSRRYYTKYRRLTVYRKIKTYFRNIRNRIIRSCNNRRWRI